MKIWKVALAALLAGGTVYAYLNFPNPMEQQVEALAAEKARPEETAGVTTETPAPPAELH